MMFRKKSILPLSLMLALTGCSVGATGSITAVQPGVPATTATGSTATATATGTVTPGAKVPGSIGEDAVGSQVAGTTKIVPGTNSSNATVEISVPNAVNAPKITNPGTPMEFKALSGGKYVSADGKLTANIPPGALSKDAVVRIHRIDTAGQAVTANHVPGIKYQVDLGGALLKADTSIVVTAEVDSRFVAEMQSRDKAFTPEKYNLSKNAAGQWTMAMAVNGATSKPSTPKTIDPDATLLMEFGTLALPVAPAASRKIMAFSTPADCSTWTSTIIDPATGQPVPIPQTMAEWRSLENSGIFDCGIYDQFEWFINIFRDLSGTEAPCGATPPSGGGSTPVVPLEATEVPAHVTYTSDDPAFDGKDAAGSMIRFNFAWAPNNGPTDVVADDTGNGKSSTMDGFEVGLNAYSDVGPVVGDTVPATAAVGMAKVELKLPWMSPLIQLTVDSEVALTDTVTVSYTLDGVAGEQTISATAGELKATGEFRLLVPDSADHKFVLTGAKSGADSGMEKPLDELLIKRNGKYPVAIKLINIAPK